MKIELVPVIEIPTFKYVEFENISDPEEKYRTLVEENYEDIPKLKSIYGFYEISKISDRDLKRVIDLHVADLPFEDNCALFGGYALKVEDDFVLFPQCCGTLSKIVDWMKILDENFQSFYFQDSHPSPYLRQENNDVIIVCDPTDEDFSPPTAPLIRVNYEALVVAIENLCEELKGISKRLDQFNAIFETESVSKILIWQS